MVAPFSPLSQFQKADNADKWEGLQPGRPVKAILPHGADLTQTGLSLPSKLDLKQWQEVGEQLCKMDRIMQWAIGDWWCFGYHAYGDRHAIATAKALPYEFGSLMNLGYVARKVKTSLRNEVLSFTHHATVAPLPPDEQKEWLLLAVAEGLTVKQLREHIHSKEQTHLNEHPELRARQRAEDLLSKAHRALPLQQDGFLVSPSDLDLLDDRYVQDLLAAIRKVAIIYSSTVEQLERCQKYRSSSDDVAEDGIIVQQAAE